MKLSYYLRRMCVFPLKSFHIEDIKCLIPCDFAPGLSLPYPSRRLITPHTPTPAPIAVTTVFNPVTAVVKNDILIYLFLSLNLICDGKSFSYLMPRPVIK